jgi:prepilin-type N-terminal cleavage/methylation domain-containing protein
MRTAPRSARSSDRRRAFTIIELLVVVAILSLLLAMLLPALGRARELARENACAANCKQWGVGVRAYATDNDNYFPDNRNTLPAGVSYPNWVPGRHVSWNSSVVQMMWDQYMSPNTSATKNDLHDVLNCPTQTWHQVNDVSLQGGLVGYFYLPGRNPDGQTNYSFAGDEWAFRAQFDGPFRRAPILIDMKQYHTGWNSWFFPTQLGKSGPISSHARPDGEPFGGNFLFEDGSVRWHPSDLDHNPAYIDPTDHIQLGATIGGWWTYFKIPLD